MKTKLKDFQGLHSQFSRTIVVPQNCIIKSTSALKSFARARLEISPRMNPIN